MPDQSLDEPMNPLLEVAGRVDIDHLCVLLRTDRDEGPTNEENRQALERRRQYIFGLYEWTLSRRSPPPTSWSDGSERILWAAQCSAASRLTPVAAAFRKKPHQLW